MDQGEEMEISIEQALAVLLLPVYEQTNVGESLDEFIHCFLEEGGKIKIEMPQWLTNRISNSQYEIGEEDGSIPTGDSISPTFKR